MAGTFKDYYNLLNKRLEYLHKLLQNFKSKRLAMMNKDRAFFQYNSRDLVHIITPLKSQLHTASRKVMIKYVVLIVIYKIIDPSSSQTFPASCRVAIFDQSFPACMVYGISCSQVLFYHIFLYAVHPPPLRSSRSSPTWYLHFQHLFCYMVPLSLPDMSIPP